MRELSLATSRKSELVDITADVREAIAGQGGKAAVVPRARSVYVSVI